MAKGLKFLSVRLFKMRVVYDLNLTNHLTNRSIRLMAHIQRFQTILLFLSIYHQANQKRANSLYKHLLLLTVTQCASTYIFTTPAQSMTRDSIVS